MRKILRYLLMLTAVVAVASACSTEKAKWGNIQYHNTTCHYNVWWNGNESLKAGREKLYKSAIDDYTQLLTVEALGTADNARSINPEMDRAIEKGVKGIKKHSIYVKGEEHVPYIKECYLLTAYATFYKQDYESTVNTCNILVNQFPGTRAGDEGAVLMARCLVRDKRYAEAEAALDQLVANLAKGNFSRSQRDKLYMAMVEATLPQQKYKKAVEYIHQAIDATSDRTAKARLTFIMAQVYQQLDKRSVAAKYYHQVLSYGPEYVMEFNARLGEASCADLEHSDIGKLERQLDAMLHDKKNEEYRDQIYYAKGEMFLGVKDAKRACDNYRLSVSAATTNRAQKARSALRMAEVLYDLYENYDLAQTYYDTAMQIIKSDYPGYADIRRRYDLLTELATYTRAYTHADSLLAVAALPEDERMALINAKIDTLVRREQEAREREILAEMTAETKAQQNGLTGDWYFYNQSTVQKGKETFRQRWGLRALEDLWCISNKNMMSMLIPEAEADAAGTDTVGTDTAQSTTATVAATGNPNDPHSPAYYLKQLPTTQRALDSIDSLTSASLLGAGYILYDGIHNTPRALECYLRLAKDYTSYDDIVQAFFMLYRIYDRQGNTPQANYYRDMVLMGFPDSDFANLIRDNEFYKELLARDKRVEEDYAEVYDQYQRRRYASVINLATQAEELYPASPMLPRFLFWKSMALASRGDRYEAIAQLESIIANNPRTDSIVPIAQAQLELLRSDSSLLADRGSEEITPADERRARANAKAQEAAPTDTAASAQAGDALPPEAQVFRYRPNQQYYVIVIVNDRNVRAMDVQYRLTDFNSEYYSNKGYRVNSTLFTDTTQMLTVHRFMSEDEAMGYYRHLQQDESPLRRYADADHTEFIISNQNYATFYNLKNVGAYLAFFRKYYLK